MDAGERGKATDQTDQSSRDFSVKKFFLQNHVLVQVLNAQFKHVLPDVFFPGQGGSDPQTVPRGGEDAAAAVQGTEGAHPADHTQGGAEDGGPETQGGADEETGGAG